MTPSAKFGLKYAGTLFVALLVAFGASFSLLALLVMPLVRWAIHGELYFPTSATELMRLAIAIFAMAAIATALMWLEGKFKGRY